MPKEINKTLSQLSPQQEKEDDNVDSIIVVNETCPSPNTGNECETLNRLGTIPMTRSRSALVAKNHTSGSDNEQDLIVKKVTVVSNGKNFDDSIDEDVSDEDRFVSNLNEEMDAEQVGTLNDIDKNFFILHFNECVNQVTDSHNEILDAFMTKRDTEEAIEKKYSRKINLLKKELSEIKIDNIDLRHKNKSLNEETSFLKKSSAADGTKRVNDMTTKKNNEISKLRIEVKSLKLEVAKEKAKNKDAENPKKLVEEKLAHSKTKEVLNLKIKNKEDVIDMLKKEKSELATRNKDLSKKLDGVEKEFRTFTKSHSLLVTKQKGQLTLQKTKNSDKLRERNEKSAQKAESFLRLQQSMRSAVGVGSFHSHSNDCGRSFRDMPSMHTQNSELMLNTQPPMLNIQPPIAHQNPYMGHNMAHVQQETFPFMPNNLTRAQQVQTQQHMMGLSIHTAKQQMMEDNVAPSEEGTQYDFQQDDYPPTQLSKKKKTKKNNKRIETKHKKPKAVPRKLPTRNNCLADYDFTRSPTSPSSMDTDESTTPSVEGLSQPLI